jgi:hypothetical protein
MNKKLILNFGVGTWDSWGFGLSYCRYSQAITVEFIHWYAYVEVYTPQEVKQVVTRKKVSKDVETYRGDAYCVNCKERREFEGIVKTSDSGRKMAMGNCPVCGTKVNRILGKAQA